MDFLRKVFVFSFMFLISAVGTHAQDFTEIQTAFSASYKYEADGDYTKASEAVKKVFQKDSYEINLRLAWLSYKAGLLDESESYYRRSIQLMPYSLEARFGLIYPLSSAGTWDQVIKIYNEILSIDPQNSIANFRLALVYYGREDYVRAEKLFSKVVNLFPFDYDGVHMLAWTKLKNGKSQEAKALFQKALLYKPGDISSLDGLSLIR
jgi:tetratricopeptide (TPR) repeat protein